jgi:hypothetical protein
LLAHNTTPETSHGDEAKKAAPVVTYTNRNPCKAGALPKICVALNGEMVLTWMPSASSATISVIGNGNLTTTAAKNGCQEVLQPARLPS